MNTKELQTEAARLNIKGRSKMLKDELVGAILAHPDSRITTNRRGDLTLKEDLQSDIEALPEWERQLIEENLQEGGTVVIDDLSSVQRELMEQAQERIDTATTKRAEKPSRVMGLHFRGRAMGAKHHALIRAAMLAPQVEAEPVDPFMARDDFRHTPNSERVQKYARQNDLAGVIHKRPVPKLTHRQMRRVRKNAIKHGEGFVMAPAYQHHNGHSLLARTPDGVGIFYRYLQDA